MGIGSQARLPFRTESIPYLCDRNRAFTKNNGARRMYIHDGRRGTLGQFSGIYNKIYVRNGLSQLCQNTFYRMLRVFATSVGTRPRVWLAECMGKFKSKWIIRHSYSKCIDSASYSCVDTFFLFKNKCQRTGPKHARKQARFIIHDDIVLRRFAVSKNGMYRLPFVSPLYALNLRNRRIRKRVGAKSIQRVGRINDNATGAKSRRGLQCGGFYSYIRKSNNFHH